MIQAGTFAGESLETQVEMLKKHGFEAFNYKDTAEGESPILPAEMLQPSPREPRRRSQCCHS